MWRNRVKTLLDDEELEYETASREVAKAVLVRDGGGRFLMAVVPASCRLDLEALARASCHRGLTLATEEEIAALFPDCEPGALPPFGNLYDIPTFLDACVCDAPEIHFSAGSRREVVGMPISDYLWAARPMLGQFCRHGGAARADA